MGSVRTGVMLALQADEENLKKMPEYVLFQRKYNGERCRVEWKDENPNLVSSCGNYFPFFSNIKNELKELGLAGMALDGELYCHGMSREMIHSISARRQNKHEKEDLIKFMVFDCIAKDVNQLERLKVVSMSIPEEAKFVEKVKSKIDNKERLIYYADLYVKEGFEGVIIRNPTSFYNPRKCSSMLKFKPNEEDEYLITGFKEEVSQEGFGKNRLGAILVKDSDENEFFVGSGISLTGKERERLWKIRHKLIGATAIVKHSKIETVNAIPTCTSLVRIKIVA